MKSARISSSLGPSVSAWLNAIPDPSALLTLLGELKITNVTGRIRLATEVLQQELIERQATTFIGAGPFELNVDRSALRNGTCLRTLTPTTGI